VISVSAPNLIVTAFKKAEDANAVVMRVRETDGKETKAQFTVRWMAGSAQPCDLMEHPVGEPLTITEEKFESAVGSYRLSSFLIPIEPK
jgi:alpha-mannosidase